MTIGPRPRRTSLSLQVHAGAPPKLLPLGRRPLPRQLRQGARRGVGSIPVLAEAWATAERCPPSRGRGTVTLLVNRSPVAAPIRIAPSSDKQLAICGCNLAHSIDRVPPGGAYDVVLAVTSPVIPVTTEGKEPDLEAAVGRDRARARQGHAQGPPLDPRRRCARATSRRPATR